MLIREVAESVGLRVPASKYKEDMSKQFLFGNDKSSLLLLIISTFALSIGSYFLIEKPLPIFLLFFEKIKFKPNQNVDILGAGSIGKIIAKLSIYYKSKKIFLIDVNNYKLSKGISGKNIFKFNFKNYKKKIFSIINNNFII